MNSSQRILDIQLSRFYKNKYRANGDGDDENVVDVDAIDLEVQNNITFWNSGGTAATAGAGSALASTAAPAALPAGIGAGLTKATVLVPVIGQAVAVVATAVAIGQIFHNIDKAGQYKRIITKTKNLLADQDFVQSVNEAAYNDKLFIYNQELAYREAQLARTQTLNTIVICVVGVSGLIFTYGIVRLNKK